VSFDVFREGTGFDFRAVDAAGGVHLAGATVETSPNLTLAVHTPALGDIQIVRDGAVVREEQADRLILRNPEPGIYRVQVFTPAHSPWLISGTIRVAARSRDDSQG